MKKDKDSVSFEELLSSLNKAIEENNAEMKVDAAKEDLKKSIKDADKEFSEILDKTLTMPPVGDKSGTFRDKITDTFRKLKNPDVYRSDELFDDLSDVKTNEFMPAEYKAESAVEDEAKNLEDEAEEEAQKPKKTSVPLKERISGLAEKVSAWVKKSSARSASVEEYTDPEDTKRFLSSFGKANNSVLVRIVATAVLSFILFYIDLVPVVNIKLLPSFLMPPEYNVVYTLVQLQILLFIIIINRKSVSVGFANIISGAPTPDSITLVASAAIIIHDIVTVLTCTKETSVCVYNSVCAVCFLMGLAYEFLNVRTRLSAFRIASGKSAKYVISCVSDDASEKAVFSDYADDTHRDMYRVARTKFVDGVMNKISVPSKIENYLRLAIPAAVAVSLVFLFVTVKNGGAAGYHAFTLCLMMTLPASMFASASYPQARMQSLLERYGTAVLGADCTEKLSESGVISFNDSDVFPSTGIKVNNILIFGNNRIDHVIYYAAGAFSKIGGPLRDVFSSADETGAGACSDIRIVKLGSAGFVMSADGKEITVGKATYLREKGYLTETSDVDAAYESKGGRIMYMAYDGAIAAKFYIKYTMDPEFDLLLRKADSIGVYVGIRTFDPNIDDTLLATSLDLGKYPVKVVKLGSADTLVTETERSDCPAVSRGAKGGAKALLSAMYLANRIKFLRKLHLVLICVSVAAAAIITALLIHAGTFVFTYALYPILFQLLWTAVAACMTNLTLQ